MSLITRPTIRRYDKEAKVAKLQFGDSKHPLNGDYYMRGGICFPIPVRLGADHGANGFALMAGCNIDTRKIYVFEETSFLTIDPIVGDDGGVEMQGLCGWLLDCWSFYFAKDFYWHQDPETKKTYSLEIHRSAMVNPKPALLHIDWNDDTYVEHLIWRLGNTGAMKFKADGALHDCLRLLEIQTEKTQIIPGVHALKCLLAGLTRYPYKRREKTDER